MKIGPVVLFRANVPMRPEWATDDTDSDIGWADMLRYDDAFTCERDPGLVAFPTIGSGLDRTNGRPTIDRWRSFGVALVHLDLAGLNAARQQWEETAGWTTRRHPIDVDGRSARDLLVAVPLRAYMAARDYVALNASLRGVADPCAT